MALTLKWCFVAEILIKPWLLLQHILVVQLTVHILCNSQRSHYGFPPLDAFIQWSILLKAIRRALPAVVTDFACLIWNDFPDLSLIRNKMLPFYIEMIQVTLYFQWFASFHLKLLLLFLVIHHKALSFIMCNISRASFVFIVW